MGKGRAYQCTRCGLKEVKGRIEAHIYKLHVPLEQSPFYCSLCMFRCNNEKQLLSHVKGYKGHRARIERGEKDSPRYLHRSTVPYKLSASIDYVQLSKEDSEVFWQQRKRVGNIDFDLTAFLDDIPATPAKESMETDFPENPLPNALPLPHPAMGFPSPQLPVQQVPSPALGSPAMPFGPAEPKEASPGHGVAASSVPVEARSCPTTPGSCTPSCCPRSEALEKKVNELTVEVQGLRKEISELVASQASLAGLNGFYLQRICKILEKKESKGAVMYVPIPSPQL